MRRQHPLNEWDFNLSIPWRAQSAASLARNSPPAALEAMRKRTKFRKRGAERAAPDAAQKRASDRINSLR
jgi:hypothetical protein